MKFILAHKKKLLAAVVALLGLYVAVTEIIPGDQKEAQVKAAQEKVSEFADKLPADAE